MAATVLSTKKLSAGQKNLLLQAGLGLVEYNAIAIEFLEFTQEYKSVKNAIITSRNAAKALLKNKATAIQAFCVGEKTTRFLEENGFQVKETANYGKDLAGIIVEKYRAENFIFFCGNLRRDDIPQILEENNVSCKEVKVYKTSLNPRKFERSFDGVLFFSPSAIQSFVTENSLKNTTAFCIGTTTAEEAEKHTENISIANSPSVESVIVQAVKKLK